jgi:acyl-CoA synthetase (AMP-forming)/AMP-acid ligase II
MNLASIVATNARNLATKPAILGARHVVTYQDLGQAIESFAKQLFAKGVREGDHVGLAMKDHPNHLITHYAVARLGAVILPIDHRWTPAEQQSTANAFDAKLIVTDGQSHPDITTVMIDDKWYNNCAVSLPKMPDSDSLELVISLSSGTTGKPKGAYVTHRQMYERFINQWVAIGFDSNDCFALVTPLYFGAGRSFSMCMLAAGGSVRIVPPPYESRQIIEKLSEPPISVTFLPPTLLRRLLPLAPVDGKLLLPNLHYLLVSGEPLYSEEAAECRKRINPNLFGYYASSEGGGICLLKPEEFKEFAHTTGRPTFRTDVQIVDEQGIEIPTGKTGRLRYRGPGVAQRFVNSDGSEQSPDIDGWFYPGDLAIKLESGHIELRGRDKDVIIRGGINIYPAEIERALMQHPNIVEAAVVGRSSSKTGQSVIAFIVTSAELDSKHAIVHCRDRLAPYKIPEEIVSLESLPKRPSGKVDKKLLEEQGVSRRS